MGITMENCTFKSKGKKTITGSYKDGVGTWACGCGNEWRDNKMQPVCPSCAKAMISKTKPIKIFRQGSTPMGTNAVDFYTSDGGKYLKHEWAMGGEGFSTVSELPDSIDGHHEVEVV